MTVLTTPTPADAVALAALKAATFIEAFGPANDPNELATHVARFFNEDTVRRELQHPASETVWLVEGDRPIAYLKANRSAAHTERGLADGLEVQQIYVRATHQGLGHGRTLLTHAIERARHHELAFAWLSVWNENDAAIAFYRHNGFEAFAERTFYFGDEAQLDVVMRRVVNVRSDSNDRAV